MVTARSANKQADVKDNLRELGEKLSSTQKVESPKKDSGRISRKFLHDKKVHDIVLDLHKYDELKSAPPAFKQNNESSKKKIDLSKIDQNIFIDSNILNITIGQITS